MRRLALWLAVAIIVAATFPWDVRDHPHWQKVAWVPFAGIVRARDLAANLVLYAPLGFVLGSLSGRRRIALLVLWPCLLSLGLEIAQVWSHVRFPSATDVLMNILGTVLGATVAWRYRRARYARVAA